MSRKQQTGTLRRLFVFGSQRGLGTVSTRRRETSLVDLEVFQSEGRVNKGDNRGHTTAARPANFREFRVV